MQVQGSSDTGENMYEHYIYGADGKADGLKIHSGYGHRRKNFGVLTFRSYRGYEVRGGDTYVKGSRVRGGDI